MDFFQDFLNSLVTRARRRAKPNSASNEHAYERLVSACKQLMRQSGEASRVALAGQALDAFGALSAPEKEQFFYSLLAEYGADPSAIRASYEAWNANGDQASLAKLFAAVEPSRQTLLRRLNFAEDGTYRLDRMRADLLRATNDQPDLAPLDADFSHLLSSWFNRGFLVMRQINWETSAAILEKVVAYEAVHEIKGWEDLRRRLNPNDRRCYGFFHPATGNEPLIFVEVALCRGIPNAIDTILSDSGSLRAAEAETAVFYSISNCQPGLKGISFGNFLIKQVARELARDLPNLRTFVTLSPAPGFAAWLGDQSAKNEVAAELHDALCMGAWIDDHALCAVLAPQVEHFAARNIVDARTERGAPTDPVARFHLGNGASAHRINWPADYSPTALRQGHGVMINYLYEPDEIEKRHEAFVEAGTIDRGHDVERALTALPKVARKLREDSNQ